MMNDRETTLTNIFRNSNDYVGDQLRALIYGAKNPTRVYGIVYDYFVGVTDTLRSFGLTDDLSLIEGYAHELGRYFQTTLRPYYEQEIVIVGQQKCWQKHMKYLKKTSDRYLKLLVEQPR